MFRKLLIGPALAVSLASCSTLSGGGLDSNTIDQIAAYTRAACSFIPTAVTIANIIAANNANLTKASEIAAAICAAVAGVAPRAGTTVALSLNANSPRIPRVAGVPIEGTFVR